MQIDKRSILEIAEAVALSVVDALKREGIVGNGGKPKATINEKSAYSKTEALLYNYNNFKKIVDERMKEIDDIRKYGVPQSCGAVGERVQSSRTNVGIVLPEESVEAAVKKIEYSIVEVVKVINMIDSRLYKMQNDPYYKIIPLRYFQGCTLEDIGVELSCDTSTISRNKNRLVKELSMWLFPNEVAIEHIV
jgi:hypothetical protein